MTIEIGQWKDWTKYAIEDYEVRCPDFADKCKQVLNGEIDAYYTRCKITDAFWLLAGFQKVGDTSLECYIWRGSYEGKAQGKLICKMQLADAVTAFPELEKANWLEVW